MKKGFEKNEGKQLHHLPASEKHPADTHFHFSPADYQDPVNISIGVLDY